MDQQTAQKQRQEPASLSLIAAKWPAFRPILDLFMEQDANTLPDDTFDLVVETLAGLVRQHWPTPEIGDKDAREVVEDTKVSPRRSFIRSEFKPLQAERPELYMIWKHAINKSGLPPKETNTVWYYLAFVAKFMRLELAAAA